MKGIQTALGCLLFAWCAAAQTAAPSFNCAKAINAVEKLVCKDSELASLDSKLATLYGAALKKDPAFQKTKQREWLNERNACANSSPMRDCVLASYQQRIAAVQIQAGMLQAPKTVSFACDGFDKSKPVSMAYYNDIDPPVAVMTYGSDRAVMVVQPSGSGARYGAPGVEFWEHHGEALVTWRGQKATCKPR